MLAFINAYKANGITNIILSVTVAISFGLIVTLVRPRAGPGFKQAP